jgi:hypothetical protein
VRDGSVAHTDTGDRAVEVLYLITDPERSLAFYEALRLTSLFRRGSR